MCKRTTIVFVSLWMIFMFLSPCTGSENHHPATDVYDGWRLGVRRGHSIVLRFMKQ